MQYKIYELTGGSWSLIKIVDGDESALITALEAASTGPWSRQFTVFRAAGRRIVGYSPAGDRLVQTRWDRRGFAAQNGRVSARALPWGDDDKGHTTTDWADVGVHGPIESVPRGSSTPRS